MADVVASSLSITGDELELFFVARPSASTLHSFAAITRTSKGAAFGAPAPLDEVQATCAAEDYPALDVTADGSRMYFTCADGPAPLRIARRSARGAAWVVAPDPIGIVGDSITVSGDELTAVGVENLSTEPRPTLSRRRTTNEAFAAAMRISGIDGGFINPELSSDGHTLFGASRVGDSYRIVFVAIDENFDASMPASTEGMPAPPAASVSASDYTPTISADCRSMYFLRSLPDTSTNVPHYTIEHVTR
jgi:hypothetical protein